MRFLILKFYVGSAILIFMGSLLKLDGISTKVSIIMGIISFFIATILLIKLWVQNLRIKR